MKARTEKLVRWFMFSVLVSLVPLALTYLNLWLDHGSRAWRCWLHGASCS